MVASVCHRWRRLDLLMDVSRPHYGSQYLGTLVARVDQVDLPYEDDSG